MGNSQTCCIADQDKECLQQNTNSITYARKINNFGAPTPSVKAKQAKNLFSGSQMKKVYFQERQTQNSKRKKFSHLYNYTYLDEHTLNQHVNVVQSNSESMRSSVVIELSEKNLDSVLQQSLPEKKPAFQFQLSKHFNKKTAQIEYLPLVKKVINREKFYEKQFSLIPQEKIKNIWINNYDIYKGQLDYYQKPHGYGIIVKQNGNSLLGRYNHGLPEGKMMYVFKDGSYYRGKINYDKANDAQGEYHSLKMTYIGEFKDNFFKWQRKGEYEDSLKKYGKYCWGLKDKKNKGFSQLQQTKEENTIPPLRDFTTIASFNYEYQGAFDQKQQFTGTGRLKDPHGEYIGCFSEGMKHGKGEYNYESKLKFMGDYYNNKKSGYGRLFNCDNTLAYEGNWKDDLPDGKGCSYDFSGKRTQSEFVRGISKIIAPQGSQMQ